jgi:hypothetical protein
MKARGEIWRRNLRLWLPALLFFLLGLGALVFYRLNYAGESAGLERRLEERSRQLAALQAERAEKEHLVDRAEVNRRRVEEVYQERFATRRQRLTRVIDEVKSLARRAGLSPQAITYPEEAIEELALVERSFEFTVEGTYQQLRTFINFLELSESFLILKQVELSGAGSNRPGALRISLTLSTLFSQEAGAAASVLEASS